MLPEEDVQKKQQKFTTSRSFSAPSNERQLKNVAFHVKIFGYRTTNQL